MKPILFNTDMVRAIQNGTKTVTRRVVKPQPKGHAALLTTNLLPETVEVGAGAVYAFEDGTATSPPYRPGDILYVRETWQHGFGGTYLYKASAGLDLFMTADGKLASDIPWRPSIHMPREAARIFLRVTDVRVERLQTIEEEQAVKEGCSAGRIEVTGGPWGVEDDPEEWTAVEHFRDVWNSTIRPKDRALYGWDANPCVWVIEFERCEKPEERTV